MKKTIICSVPMNGNIQETVYKSDDLSLPVSNRKSRYPITPYLEKTLSSEDKIKFVLLLKDDEFSSCDMNAQFLIDELNDINNSIGAEFSFEKIRTKFSEKQTVHEELLGEIVDNIDIDTHVLAEITYGPKDMPVIIFSALKFAEKYLRCEIDNIIYGQANFNSEGKVVNTKICDMVPLFYLNSVADAVHCNEPEKAREMLKTLLSL